MNQPVSVDRGILASVDFTGKLNGWKEILPPISPDKSEGAVMMVSEETTVDAGGDQGPVIGIVSVSGCWAMSRPGCVYGLIFQRCRWRDYW